MARTRNTSNRTVGQLTTLAQRAPFVVSQRVSRMTDGPATKADQRETQRMVAEKMAAFQEGWTAMVSEMLVQQQRAWTTLWLSAGNPWTARAPMDSWMRGMVGADRMMAAGLRPVARAVSANARRLSR